MHYRDRQCRPRGFNDPGHAHELTFSCYHHFAFLSKERSCRWLADAIEDSRRALRFELWAYVFMPDHVHLIVWPAERHYDTGEILKQDQRAGQSKRGSVPETLRPGMASSHLRQARRSERASFLAARPRS